MELLDIQKNKELEIEAMRRVRGLTEKQIMKEKRRKKKEENRIKYIAWCEKTGRKPRVKNKKRATTKTYKSYTRYIASPLWTSRKNAYWKKHKRICIRCLSPVKLELHHARYKRPFNGKEPDSDLFPLCYACHMEFHNRYGSAQDMMKETKEFIMDKSY